MKKVNSLTEKAKENLQNFKGTKIANFKRWLITPELNGRQFIIHVNKNNSICDILEIDPSTKSILGKVSNILENMRGQQISENTIDYISSFCNY